MSASAAGAAAVTVVVRRKRFANAGGPGGGRGGVVLERIEFAIGGGEFCVLLGPSGCGKTTLLNIVAGLDRDFEGAVRIPGAVAGRARAGCVFQTPRLLPWLTVADNLRLVLPPEADERAALALLEAMELGPVRDTYPNRLSGGMQRRVALARAFAIRPSLLLLDEPFVSLDGPTADRLRGLLVDLWRRERPSVLFVTHDLNEAILLADRILFLGGTPARLALDLAVDLPRPRQPGGVAEEALRRRLLAHYPDAPAERVA